MLLPLLSALKRGQHMQICHPTLRNSRPKKVALQWTKPVPVPVSSEARLFQVTRTYQEVLGGEGEKQIAIVSDLITPPLDSGCFFVI
jgi:hypothetical protein